MRNCSNCKKELHKTTKGELCFICYRNRNKLVSTGKHTMNTSSCKSNSHMDMVQDNVNPVLSPLNNTNFLQNELRRGYETPILTENIDNFEKYRSTQRHQVLIEVLAKEVEILKQELSQKDKLIDKLMNERVTVDTENDNPTLESNNDSDNESGNNSSTSSRSTSNSSVEEVGTDYLDFHTVGDEEESDDDEDGENGAANIRREMYQLREDVSGFSKFVYDELSLIKKKMNLKSDDAEEQTSPVSQDDEEELQNRSTDAAFDEMLSQKESFPDDNVHDETHVFETLIEKKLGVFEPLIEKNLGDIKRMLTDIHQNKSDPSMNDMAPWNQHSNGFASTYMKKKGHKPGTGLGKNENGITHPIKVQTTLTNNQKKSIPKDTSECPKETVLIAGTSMIGGLDETKMSRRFNIKVHSHPGATIKKMKDHLNALLRNKPEYLILEVGTNDAVDRNTSADMIFDGIADLKSFAESKVPGIQVTISCPTVRTDNSVANAKLSQLNNRLKRSGLSIIQNDDITKDHLGKRGLHLKPIGTKSLAVNMITFMRGL